MHDDVHAHLPILSLLTLCYAHLLMLNVLMRSVLMLSLFTCSHMLITALVHKRSVLTCAQSTHAENDAYEKQHMSIL